MPVFILKIATELCVIVKIRVNVYKVVSLVPSKCQVTGCSFPGGETPTVVSPLSACVLWTLSKPAEGVGSTNTECKVFCMMEVSHNLLSSHSLSKGPSRDDRKILTPSPKRAMSQDKKLL